MSKETGKTVSEEQVEVWVNLGGTMVLLGFIAFLKLRALMAAEGIPDSAMAAADAEYARRIAQAKAEQG